MESTQYRMPESVDKQAREIAIKNRVNKRLRNEKRYEAIKQTFEQIEIAKDVELMPLQNENSLVYPDFHIPSQKIAILVTD